MDALDQLIQHEKAELARMESDLSKMENAVSRQRVKVGALLAAAEARPSLATVSNKKQSGTSKGKPKGAISKLWQSVLSELYAHKGPWTFAEIQGCFEHVHDKRPELSSVRDRVRSMIENNYMVGDPESGFCVTDFAAQKFGFKRSQEFGDPAPNDEGGSALTVPPSNLFNTQPNG